MWSDHASMKITNKMPYMDLFIIPSRLYMFRAMFSPIIRSTWLYLQYLVVFTQVAAGWCPEWVETEICGLCGLIYYSKSALHVSGDVFAHHQEHLTVFTVYCVLCRLWGVCTRLTIYIVQFQLIRDTSRQQPGWTLPDTVNTVKCSWWWAKTSPETCRADLE